MPSPTTPKELRATAAISIGSARMAKIGLRELQQQTVSGRLNSSNAVKRKVSLLISTIVRLDGAMQTKGILAYLDNRPIGWCHAAEKRSLAHLATMGVLASPDDESVGSIVCFVVTQRFRGTGLSSLLLEAACDLLAKRSLQIVEAYPDRHATDSYANFHGRLDMFLDAGFQIHRELEGDMDGIVIVRRNLINQHSIETSNSP